MHCATASESFESASSARSDSGSGSRSGLARIVGDALVEARDIVSIGVLPLVGLGLLLAGLILITAGCGPPS